MGAAWRALAAVAAGTAVAGLPVAPAGAATARPVASGHALAVYPGHAVAVHPGHAVAVYPGHAVAMHPGHLPAAATGGWQSTNWSGYAQTGSGITSASGTWTVPRVVASVAPRYSASWIGVDGYDDDDLIQAGTGQDTSGGRVRYYAWWEVLPAAETPIVAMTVAPGDSVTATVRRDAGGADWTISVADTTRRERSSTTVAYGGPGGSAEWIEEAPTVDGGQSALADFGSVSFANCRVDGAPATLHPFQAGDLLGPSGRVIAAAGSPSGRGTAFTDTYRGPKPAAKVATHRRRHRRVKRPTVVA